MKLHRKRSNADTLPNFFDGYTPVIKFDKTDTDWIAFLEEIPAISAFGKTPEQALKELTEVWQGVKESYQVNGEEVPVAPSKKG